MRVGVTREDPGAGRLADLLEAAGVEPVIVPLIATGPPADGGAGLRRALAELEDGDWLIVTSPRGARAVLGGGGLPDGVRIAAVGPATSGVLEGAGRSVEVVPDRHDAATLASVLLRHGPARAVLAVSEIADDVIESVLAASGWSVRRVDAYRTVSVRPARAEIDALRSCEVVTLASGSAARALVDAGVVGPVVCLGQVTADAAAGLGLDVVAIADPSTLDGLVAAVLASTGRQES